MRTGRTFKIAAVALLMAGALAACGDAGEDDEDGDAPDVEAASDCDGKFEDGTRMAELVDAGTIKIGARFDQPGLGQKDATEDVPEGFDVDMAKLLIADLCIDPESDSVTWDEAISEQREEYLRTGRADLVAASYSITDDRRKIVGQTGPYLVTGQRVLVPTDSDVESIDDLKGEEVCSASGSTSLENVNAKGAVGVPADNYGQCAEDVVNGTVPAMSTDGSILQGLAAQYEGEVKVVGDEFSTENIGIGYGKDYPEMCEWINGVIQEAMDDGTWADLFDANLGVEGEETPEPPTLEDCQA